MTSKFTSQVENFLALHRFEPSTPVPALLAPFIFIMSVAAHLQALGKGWRDAEARAKSLERTLERERARHTAAIEAIERQTNAADERHSKALSVAVARAALLREWASRFMPPCLNRTVVVYIGDSTHRYEYLALAARLHSRFGPVLGLDAASTLEAAIPPRTTSSESMAAKAGVATPSRRQQAKLDARCQPSIPPYDHNFASSPMLFGGRELCDCWRGRPKFPLRDCCDSAVENRVYYGAAFKIAFFQWFGSVHSPRGHLSVERALSTQQRDPDASSLPCGPSFGSKHWRWSVSTAGLLAQLRDAGTATHVILGAGLWRANFTHNEWLELARAGAELRRARGTRLFWRSTPRHPRQRAQAPHTKAALSAGMGGQAAAAAAVPIWGSVNNVNESVVRLLLDHGWELYDASAVVSQQRTLRGNVSWADVFWRDRIHLQRWANDVLAEYVESNLLGCGVSGSGPSRSRVSPASGGEVEDAPGQLPPTLDHSRSGIRSSSPPTEAAEEGIGHRVLVSSAEAPFPSGWAASLPQQVARGCPSDRCEARALRCVGRHRRHAFGGSPLAIRSDHHLFLGRHCPGRFGGVGQRVAIVDTGVRATSPMWHISLPGSGGGLPKLIAEVRFEDESRTRAGDVNFTHAHPAPSESASAGAAPIAMSMPMSELMHEQTHIVYQPTNLTAPSSVLLLASGSEEGEEASPQCHEGLPHAAYAMEFGYWAVRDPEIEHATTSSCACGVQIVSLNALDSLYIKRKGGGAHRTRGSYVRALGAALHWVARHALRLNILTVQLSAIDGLYEDGSQEYAKAAPDELAMMQSALLALDALGVWVSAPSGNDRYLLERSAWPASESKVVGVGCAIRNVSGVDHGGARERLDVDGRTSVEGRSNAGCIPVLHRSRATQLLIPVSGRKSAYTSACNVHACSLAVAIRDAVSTLCAVPSHSIKASLILALMRETAMDCWDGLTQQTYPLVDAEALFQRIGRDNVSQSRKLCPS